MEVPRREPGNQTKNQVRIAKKAAMLEFVTQTWRCPVRPAEIAVFDATCAPPRPGKILSSGTRV